MSILDIECNESIFFSYEQINFPYGYEYLLIGSQLYDYKIFLSFNLPSNHITRKIKKVNLILFKIPTKDCSLNKADINLYPMLTYFNYYYISKDKIIVDYKNNISYFDNDNTSYCEIDITSIITIWAEDILENRGIILKAKDNSYLTSFASINHPITSMHPFIRIVYDDIIFNSCLSMVPCKVNIT